MKKKILFLITEDWFFLSHFLERAQAAQAAGYEVFVASNQTNHNETIKALGFNSIKISFNRSGTNPIHEAGTIIKILKIYHSIQPNIVHHIALKPILYGTLCAKLVGIKGIINAPVGMGHVFISNNLPAILLRCLIYSFFKLMSFNGHVRTIIENQDDLHYFISKGLSSEDHTKLIRGAGIDTTAFQPKQVSNKNTVISLTARMLWDKGIGEFVEAARLVKARSPNVTFQLIGAPDTQNPASIPKETLEEWNKEGIVNWLGYRSDIADLIGNSDIVCLPSYREGLPKSLLEALAAGKAVVATDVPGCREVVRSGENGILVPPRDAQALATSLLTLINDRDLREMYGKKGRQMAVAEFSSEIIIKSTLEIYEEIAA